MKRYLLFFFFIYSTVFYGQESIGNPAIDSLLKLLPTIKSDTARINKLTLIAKEYKSADPENGIKYGEQALKLSKIIKWIDGEAKSLLMIGLNNYALGEHEIAMSKYSQALKLAKDQAITAEIYKSIAAIYIAKSEYSKALQYNFKSLKISTAIKNEVGIADATYSIGVIYHYMEDSKKALAHFQKALDMNTKLKRKLGICATLRAIASAYMYLYDYPKVTIYLEKALVIAKEIGNLELQSSIYYTLGKMLMEQNEFDQAIPYAVAARENAEAIKSSGMMASTTLLEANVYVAKLTASKTIDKNLLEKAETLVKKSIAITKKTKNVLVLSQCYKTLSAIYSLRNNHKIAKETYILYTNLQDSIYSEDSRQTIENLTNQRTIDLKNNEIKVNKLQLETSKQRQWLSVFGIVFLAIIGGLLFYQNRSRRKSNEKLQVLNAELDQANKAKARFFSVLNHDLRSPVTNLIAFLHIQKQNPGLLDEETRLKMENKTISSAENLLESMEDILFWSKSQMTNFKPQPQNINVTLLFADIKKYFSTVENLQLIFENPNDLSLFTDENYLKTILRNITANAIKVLENTENAMITFKAFTKNGQTSLSVSDNGPGSTNEQFRALFDETEVVGIQTGLGLHLIRDLAKAINCKISVHTQPGDGTVFTILFP